MKKKHTMTWNRFAFFCSAMAIFGIGFLLATGESSSYEDLEIIALLAIAALSVNFFYYAGQRGEYKDERLAGIARNAMSFSWYLTLVTILIMLALEDLGCIELTISQILGIGMMVTASSVVSFNEVMVRRAGVTRAPSAASE